MITPAWIFQVATSRDAMDAFTKLVFATRPVGLLTYNMALGWLTVQAIPSAFIASSQLGIIRQTLVSQCFSHVLASPFSSS